jgi:hypothetical protein
MGRDFSQQTHICYATLAEITKIFNTIEYLYFAILALQTTIER